MFRRPSLRSTVTTLAAAAVLVGGADLASYAASGHPLILGHANSAVGTTSLKNLGRGPALSLNSARSAPPLVVNSSKLVKHLNVSKVGGQTASRLEPKTIRFTFGQPGSTFTGNTLQFFSARVPKGTYSVSMTGLLLENGGTSTDSYACLVADKALLLDVLGGGPTPTDLTKFYALGSHSESDEDFAILDNTNPAASIGTAPIAFGCTFNGTGDFKIMRTVQFTLRPTVVSTHQGTAIPIARSAVPNLARALD